jgi:tetratricopeptide (TPR) repeat protein
MPPPQGNRATAMWATDGVAPESSGLPASGPFVGNLAAIPDEPAFAGRVRMAPGDEATFETAKVRTLDEDDDVLPPRRGSRAGMLVLVMALLVMGAAAAVVYVFVIRKAQEEHVAVPARDAGIAVTVTPDAAAIVAPVVDAAPAIEPPSPLDAARGELAADVEPRLRTAMQALDGKADVPSQALRAHLIAQLAQDLQDRASVTADKALADQLRKEAKQLVLDAATVAQRALKAAGDDAGANLAMAEVLRLQGKPAPGSKRYLDTARAKADKDWTRDLALADALLLVRDGKLDEARAAFTAIDQGDGKLETSGDVRARFHLALVLTTQNKPADAKPLVEAILAAQPEHAGAKALAGKLETLVAKTDPLPPEDGAKAAGSGKTNPVGPGPGPGPGPESGGGESYDRLLVRANALADTSCTKAMELYAKALEQKPNGVEALTGMGYCHIDAKQFASAFSKFRAALAVSSRYEPALRGVAEAYQQQGRKEQAIEAYKAYLEIYPESAAAKKQLERLGGDAAAPPQPGSGAGSAPPPAPPPPAPAPPAPAPTTPEPSGAGSGSG